MTSNAGVTSWLTAKEVSEQTGYVPAYVRELVQRGVISEGIEAIKRAGIWWFSPGVVSKLKQRREQVNE